MQLTRVLAAACAPVGLATRLAAAANNLWPPHQHRRHHRRCRGGSSSGSGGAARRARRSAADDDAGPLDARRPARAIGMGFQRLHLSSKRFDGPPLCPCAATFRQDDPQLIQCAHPISLCPPLFPPSTYLARTGNKLVVFLLLIIPLPPDDARGDAAIIEVQRAPKVQGKTKKWGIVCVCATVCVVLRI